MSTLTKILIVLLTISSLFLCGTVVTYVASADNYKQKYNDLKSDTDSLQQKNKGLTQQLNEKVTQKEQTEDQLNSKIASLKTELDKAQAELDAITREKANLLQKVNSWTSITKDFYETNDKQGQLLKNTLAELEETKSKQIKLQKELDETSVSLIEKMAIIETLEINIKRLAEEKTGIQKKLDGLLQPMGKTTTEFVPVTQKKDAAEFAETETKNINLKGLITKVDMKNSIASISIGKADGVKEGMKFHITRGDEFICDVLVIEVDTEEAVGVLELVQKQPEQGDNASTNL